MKDKLIELIKESVGGCATYWASLIADHLIENGVTVQRWISVDERLPNVDETDGLYEDCLVIATDGFASRVLYYERATVRGKAVYRWKWHWDRIYDGNPIIAWQPLPEPKREEK